MLEKNQRTMGRLKDDTIQQVYFFQSEVADILDMSVPVVRTWKKFFFPELPRARSGRDRTIPLRHLEKFKILYLLIYKEGYTLKGTKKRLRAMKKKEMELYINKFDTMRNEEGT